MTLKDRKDALVTCTFLPHVSMVTFLYCHFSLSSMNWYLETSSPRTEDVVQDELRREPQETWTHQQWTQPSLRNSCFTGRNEEHFGCKPFAVTLGCSFATWTSAFLLTCDCMHSTREIGKKDLYSVRCLCRQPEYCISSMTGEWVQRPHVLQLWQATQNWRKYLEISICMKLVSKD